jgi:membrane-bound lytic murein transglycosylase D
MILAAIIIAKNPSQYGFYVEPSPPLAYEKVSVPRAFDLRRVAEWTGTSIQDIQDLNPELRRWTTPVKSSYEVKVPPGTASMLEARLKEASPADFTGVSWHLVKRGESLSTIARNLKVSRTDLAEANGLRTTSRVLTGQELIIPRMPAAALSARIDTPAPKDQVLTARSLGGVVTAALAQVGSATYDAPPTRAASTETATPAAAKVISYRVKRGDTLFSIARLFDTTVAALKSWNKLRSNFIAAGDRLTILRGQSE